MSDSGEGVDIMELTDHGPTAENPAGDEISEALNNDDTRLGDVYRLTLEGKTPVVIAAELEVPNPGFVYSYRQQADAILGTHVPGSAHIASQGAARVRKWLKVKTWSPAAKEHLGRVLEALEQVASDAPTIEREERNAIEKTIQAEKQGVPGIYVYSLPHYLRHPYNPETGHTLFKVGHSSVDIFARVGGQARTTALPEDPVLLRIYETLAADSQVEERQFHEWLEAADHARSRTSKGGREWFLTSTKFLDRIAAQRGLKVSVIADLDGSEL